VETEQDNSEALAFYRAMAFGKTDGN